MVALQAKIRYQFRNPELLRLALTHASCVAEYGIPSNERLEFLGDSILGFLFASEFYLLAGHLNPGQMTVARQAYASNKALAQMAEELGLADLLHYVKMPTLERPSMNMMADAFEALVGAIYLDSDIHTTRRVILDLYNFVEGKTYAEEVQMECDDPSDALLPERDLRS